MKHIKPFQEFKGQLGEMLNNPIFNNMELARQTNDSTMKNFLDSLSDEELKKIWKDYRLIPTNYTFDNPLSLWMNVVDEGLIRSYPPEKTIEYVSNYFGLVGEQVKTYGEGENCKIELYIPITEYNLNLIKKAMRLCGYYYNAPIGDDLKYNTWQWVQFEPCFQKDDTQQIRKEETKLYHLTPYYNIKKIQKIGLSPRCKNEMFNYPDRVYLLRGSVSYDDILHIGNELCAKNKVKHNDGKYALLTIDINKIPDDVKFFIDLNYKYGIFTTSNISKDAIIEIEEILFNTKI